MGGLGRRLIRAAKWCLAAAAALEVLSFLVVTAANFVLYGHAREGSRAVYDAHTLFLMSSGVRPTAHNRLSIDPARNRAVWVFGGSTVRGATDRDDRTIPSFLAKFLNAEGRSPWHFTVSNFGVNSFNSLLESQYLQKLLEESGESPDLIVFYDGANDAKYLAECRTPYAHHGYRKVRGLIESYYQSPIGLLKPLVAAGYASFTWELYDKLHQVALPMDPDLGLVRQMAEATARRYDHLDRLARCQGAAFLLFWQPVLWAEECDGSRDGAGVEKGAIATAAGHGAVRRNFTVPYEAILGKLYGRPYLVDLRNALCGRSAPAYQDDGVHLTDWGRERVAQMMARSILERSSLAP
jgi:lysophospholipase L1-like esterase